MIECSRMSEQTCLGAYSVFTSYFHCVTIDFPASYLLAHLKLRSCLFVMMMLMGCHVSECHNTVPWSTLTDAMLLVVPRKLWSPLLVTPGYMPLWISESLAEYIFRGKLDIAFQRLEIAVSGIGTLFWGLQVPVEWVYWLCTTHNRYLGSPHASRMSPI